MATDMDHHAVHLGPSARCTMQAWQRSTRTQQPIPVVPAPIAHSSDDVVWVQLQPASRASLGDGVLRNGDAVFIYAFPNGVAASDNGAAVALGVRDDGVTVSWGSPGMAGTPWRVLDAAVANTASPFGTPIWANQAVWLAPVEDIVQRVGSSATSPSTWQTQVPGPGAPGSPAFEALDLYFTPMTDL